MRALTDRRTGTRGIGSERSRGLDRDEFDQLTGIASLRSEFGWDLG